MEKKPFTTEIATERLILKQRKLTFKTAQDLADLIKRHREFLSKWMPWALKPNTAEDCYASSLRSVAKWEVMSNADYLIYDKFGILMGSISMKDIDYDVASGEIGYWLGEEFNGHGYVTEAVKALENEFFTRGMNRITITTDSTNQASANVAVRCGYTQEGILRHNEWNALHTEHRDTKIFAKLRKEWEQ